MGFGSPKSLTPVARNLAVIGFWVLVAGLLGIVLVGWDREAVSVVLGTLLIVGPLLGLAAFIVGALNQARINLSRELEEELAAAKVAAQERRRQWAEEDASGKRPVPLGRAAQIDRLADAHDVDGLIQELHAEDVQRKGLWFEAVIRGLARTRDDRAVGALELVALDEDRKTFMRASAIQGLGDLAHPRAVQALGACLDDSSSPAVHQRALKALRKPIRRATAGEQVDVPLDRVRRLAEGALRDPYWPTRRQAARVLADLSAPEPIHRAIGDEATLRRRRALKAEARRASKSQRA